MGYATLTEVQSTLILQLRDGMNLGAFRSRSHQILGAEAQLRFVSLPKRGTYDSTHACHIFKYILKIAIIPLSGT